MKNLLPLTKHTITVIIILCFYFSATLPIVKAAENTKCINSAVNLLLLNDKSKYSVWWESKFNLPPQDANGWSILTPSSDSRLIYVSSTEGNDDTGQFYLPSHNSIGADPFLPAGTILSYATIDAALAQARDGYPDYILLRRGDSWDRISSIALKSGRSAAERTVLAAYGSEKIRPLVKNNGVQLSKASFSAVIGIQFTATKRNPASPDFVGFDHVENTKGFQLLSGYGGTVQGSVLIEDCRFDWFSNNTIQDAIDNGGVLPNLTDIIIRRNIIDHNYSTVAHAQGIFSSYASVLLEENIFDHNGWYKQGSGNSKSEGMATMFNHNTYFAEPRETIFRNNIFLRPSSINNKFTSNTVAEEGTTVINEIKAWDILLYNNFYAEGEVVISLGGNKDQDNGPRWRNIHVVGNIATHVGRTHPTGRSLGWGLDISDWQGGYVFDNIFTSWGDVDTLTNTWAIQSVGHTTDVLLRGNIAANIVTGGSLVGFSDGDIQTGITFIDNDIQANVIQTTGSKGRLLATSLEKTGNSFGYNKYFSANDMSTWFTVSGVKYSSLEDYRMATDDTTSQAERQAYLDNPRTIEDYLTAHGYSSDMESFAGELYKQSKFNWRGSLTAQSINKYIREGYK